MTSDRRTAPVLAPVRDTFRAIATTVVPEAVELDEEGWSRVEAVVEEALEGRPPSLKGQLRLFLRLAEWWPVPRYGRRLPALADGPRRRVLARLERSRLLRVRRGVWGVRTLVFMGFYALPEVRKAIGYAAHVRGRQARGAGGPGGTEDQTP